MSHRPNGNGGRGTSVFGCSSEAKRTNNFFEEQGWVPVNRGGGSGWAPGADDNLPADLNIRQSAPPTSSPVPPVTLPYGWSRGLFSQSG